MLQVVIREVPSAKKKKKTDKTKFGFEQKEKEMCFCVLFRPAGLR